MHIIIQKEKAHSNAYKTIDFFFFWIGNKNFIDKKSTMSLW